MPTPLRYVTALLVLAGMACGDDGTPIRIIDATIDEMQIDTPMTDAALPLSPQAYIKATVPRMDDRFGGSEATTAIALSADGSTLAVSSVEDRSNAVGIDGVITDYSVPFSGAVWIYVRAGGVWSPQAYIKASDATEFDRFGTGVAVSGDGNTLVVGAPGASSSGRVYVFTRSGAAWSEQTILTTSNADPSDFFGWHVSISGNGDMIAASAIGEASNGVGGFTDNSAAGAGAAYVFTRSGTIWNQQAYLKPSDTDAGDQFGWRVSLSADTTMLAASALLEDSGSSDPANDSADGAGAVYVFNRSGVVWSQTAYVKASNIDAGDHFGGTLALNTNGQTLAVGTEWEKSAAVGINGDQTDNSITLAGAVYVLARSGTTWSHQAYIKARNTSPGASGGDVFAATLAISGDGHTLAVGAHVDDSSVAAEPVDVSVTNSGAVYVFQRTGTTWASRRYVKASNPDVFDFFGDELALSRDGSTLAVGAPGEDSAAAGVGGNGADDSLSASGAVYVYAP